MKYLVATCVKSDCHFVTEQLCPMSDANANAFIDLANRAAWQLIEQAAQAHVLATDVYGHAVEIHLVIRT